MAGTRAAVAASIVSAEREGSGASGTRAKLAAAGFEIGGTPYDAFIERYFARAG
jgi:hypothetical protein